MEVSLVSPRSQTECWIEPETGLTYPTAYRAYRRAREAQEKLPARHRSLGPEVERRVWQHWRQPAAADVDVVLTFRQGASPRAQRIVGEVLRSIRRGRPAGEAIRHVARRFGLRHGHARAFISASITFEVRAQHDPPRSPPSPLTDWT
jgi:hypothetical protein